VGTIFRQLLPKIMRIPMYSKIMVPLDGSDLAECVIPHVTAIITAFKSKEVVLVRVVNPVRLPISVPAQGEFGFTEKDRHQLDTNRKKAAEVYLEKMVASLDSPGTVYNFLVLEGNTANILTDYATKNDVDLIVIASHGRSGVSRWLMGSVAERIMRTSCVPVMMVRAPRCESKAKSG
jgi:nucleotide-binding universal stress UspA family protein